MATERQSELEEVGAMRMYPLIGLAVCTLILVGWGTRGRAENPSREQLRAEADALRVQNKELATKVKLQEALLARFTQKERKLRAREEKLKVQAREVALQRKENELLAREAKLKVQARELKLQRNENLLHAEQEKLEAQLGVASAGNENRLFVETEAKLKSRTRSRR